MTRAVLIFVSTLAPMVAGCAFNTHGNREEQRPLVTRYGDLRGKGSRVVTLVGTARAAAPDPGDVTLDMTGGTVLIPAYAWPADYVDQPVTITGTLFELRDRKGYHLGEIRSASKWGR